MTCKYFFIFSPSILQLLNHLEFTFTICLDVCKVFTSDILSKYQNSCLKYRTIYDCHSVQ